MKVPKGCKAVYKMNLKKVSFRKDLASPFDCPSDYFTCHGKVTGDFCWIDFFLLFRVVFAALCICEQLRSCLKRNQIRLR